MSSSIGKMVDKRFEDNNEIIFSGNDEETKSNKYQLQIKWVNVVLIGTLHCFALYGMYLFITACQFKTMFAWYTFGLISGRMN